MPHLPERKVLSTSPRSWGDIPELWMATPLATSLASWGSSALLAAVARNSITTCTRLCTNHRRQRDRFGNMHNSVHHRRAFLPTCREIQRSKTNEARMNAWPLFPTDDDVRQTRYHLGARSPRVVRALGKGCREGLRVFLAAAEHQCRLAVGVPG